MQVAAIASFVLARNRFANGYLAMQLGIWHFACKSHVDVKWIYSRMGSCISDVAARKALTSMSAARMDLLRQEVLAAADKGEVLFAIVLDNVQQYVRVFEHGIGIENKLCQGTFATAIRLDDVEPGAFDLKTYHDRLLENKRASLNIHSLESSIDWNHIASVMQLHFIRVLVGFAPQLTHLQSEVSKLF